MLTVGLELGFKVGAGTGWREGMDVGLVGAAVGFEEVGLEVG